MTTSAVHSTEHAPHMRRALVLAGKGIEAGELPIGVVVVLDSKIIAEAYCSDKGLKKLHHPELLVLLDVDGRGYSLRERQSMTLYTTLEPCVMCYGAVLSCCVGRIVFGLDAPIDGALARIGGPTLAEAHHPEYQRPEVIGNVLSNESRVLFEAFIDQSIDSAMTAFAERVVAGVLVSPAAPLSEANR